MSSSLPPIQVAQTQLVLFMSFILLISGIVGNTLNCLIFTRRSLRQNSCSRYFFVTSIANIFTLCFGCLTRLLNNFGIYPSPSDLALYCQMRSFINIVASSVSTWFVVGACADRYASSSVSVRIRSFSQVKIAERIIGVTIVILCLAWAEMFVCFKTTFQGVNCNPATPFCNILNEFALLIFFSLLPPILMFILGWMTIQYVRHQRVHRTIIRRDHQLTAILIVQVLCVTILTVPVSVQKLNDGFTLGQVKSQERIQLETFFGTLAVFIALTNSSTSFYMFTLTSKVFRKELKYLLFCSNRRRMEIEPLQIPFQTNKTRNQF